MTAVDYYGDDDAPASAPQSEEKPKASEGKTALIDSSICPGMQVGDEMVVKIEKVLEKEYAVSYAPEPGKDHKEPEAEAAPTGPQTSQTSPSYAGMME